MITIFHNYSYIILSILKLVIRENNTSKIKLMVYHLIFSFSKKKSEITKLSPMLLWVILFAMMTKTKLYKTLISFCHAYTYIYIYIHIYIQIYIHIYIYILFSISLFSSMEASLFRGITNGIQRWCENAQDNFKWHSIFGCVLWLLLFYCQWHLHYTLCKAMVVIFLSEIGFLINHTTLSMMPQEIVPSQVMDLIASEMVDLIRITSSIDGNPLGVIFQGKVFTFRFHFYCICSMFSFQASHVIFLVLDILFRS